MGGATFTVRAARPDDAEAITAAQVEGWQWGYRGLLPDAALDTIDAAPRLELWRRVLGGEFPDSDVWVAEQEGRVVGFVSAGPSRDEDAAEDDGEIYALYIRAAVAGTGVGRALLAAAVDALRERGARRVTLWVLADNARGRRFYERAGFALEEGAEKTAPWQGVELREVRYRRAV